ncbi:DUF502 domain-containing protein [Thalassotalea piscium]|uniref:Putative membrane protein n=1 Tax=Thalassotalea piscium TaxID=1230533 RepID=A0A7X0TS30_9GAMM|nr:DUF502 domain-containing protein [Thalassotalea piscium]MBB6541723.1 putative membrane protein [Thalassotalea piscium]
MIKRISILIIQGLLALLPISLTLYFLIWLITSFESILTPLIPPEYYFPGMGLIAGLLVMLLVGMAVNAYIVKALIKWGDNIIKRIPVVKTIYGGIQDAVNLINIGQRQKMQSVVSVQLTEKIHLIGFITTHDGDKNIFNDKDKVGVYIPLSYQIGGYTLYIDKESITPLDIDVESAMRIALTGKQAPN